MRMLGPEGWLLSEHPEMARYCADYDAEALSSSGKAAGPAVDALQGQLAALVEAGTADGHDIHTLFTRLRSLVHTAAGLPGPASAAPSTAGPRPSEAWLCCA